MTVVLDSGALVALERNERAMWIRLKAAQLGGDPLGLLVGERRRAPWGAVDDREVLNHARQPTTSN